MRLLICTQAVDKNDPALGFFHRWIEEFSKHGRVTVVCLRKGDHDLSGVEVIALGERSKFLRAIELISIAFGRRHDYDAVFVHMNPEYIAAAGWLWRLMGKTVALWYTHRSVTALLRVAALFADVIFTASKESFRLASKKVEIMGHGIDTDFFSPGTHARGDHILSAGRLMASKHHDLVIRAAALAGVRLRIAGEGPEQKMLEQLTRELGVDATFLGGLTQEELRDEYRSAAHFVHASDTGSVDKVVLEAAACDCDVITTAGELYKEISVRSVAMTPEAVADAIKQNAGTSVDRVTFIRTQHSLVPLIEQIVWKLTKNK